MSIVPKIRDPHAFVDQLANANRGVFPRLANFRSSNYNDWRSAGIKESPGGENSLFSQRGYCTFSLGERLFLNIELGRGCRFDKPAGIPITLRSLERLWNSRTIARFDANKAFCSCREILSIRNNLSREKVPRAKDRYVPPFYCRFSNVQPKSSGMIQIETKAKIFAVVC